MAEWGEMGGSVLGSPPVAPLRNPTQVFILSAEAPSVRDFPLRCALSVVPSSKGRAWRTLDPRACPAAQRKKGLV